MPQIASGSSVTLTVTSTQQILLNSGPSVRCDIEATSGVTGADTRRKVAKHRGGFGIYGPFGDGTITLFAIGGAVDYDDSIPLNSSDERVHVFQDPSTGSLYGAEGSLLDFSSRSLSGVTYDTGSRVTGFSIGGNSYTVTYDDESIVVNGPRQITAALDPAGRIVSVN